VSAVSRSICTMAARLFSTLQDLNGADHFAMPVVGPLVHALEGLPPALIHAVLALAEALSSFGTEGP
jgi:hypothetical protein